MSLADLEMRCSEMFFLERRGYILDVHWQRSIMPFLDVIDASVRSGTVDTILNKGGILCGFYVGGARSDWRIDERMAIWMTE